MPNYQKVLGGRPLVFLFGGKADPSDLYVAVALLPPREVQGYAYIYACGCVSIHLYISLCMQPHGSVILLSKPSCFLVSRSLALPLSRSLALSFSLRPRSWVL